MRGGLGSPYKGRPEWLKWSLSRCSIGEVGSIQWRSKLRSDVQMENGKFAYAPKGTTQRKRQRSGEGVGGCHHDVWRKRKEKVTTMKAWRHHGEVTKLGSHDQDEHDTRRTEKTALSALWLVCHSHGHHP